MRGQTPYRRLLLKLSGEALMGGEKSGIDHPACERIAKEIKRIQEQGIEVAVVVGGGNLFRGLAATKRGFSRVVADRIGMFATNVNGLVLQQTLLNIGSASSVLCSFEDALVEKYSWEKAVSFLNSGKVVVLVGGTGHPGCTTDTAAAFRAIELDASFLLKATQVDGVYDQDPAVNPQAEKLDHLTYGEVLSQRLKVMDGAAVALCQDHQIPIYVCNSSKEGSLFAAACHQEGGSWISGGRACLPKL